MRIDAILSRFGYCSRRDAAQWVKRGRVTIVGKAVRSASDKEPSIISDYAYTLAQLFSSFYNASPVKGAETVEIASSRVGLAKLTRDVLTTLLYLLGIEAPEVMPKA